ncbi:hypothetical protein ACWEGE_05810 [Amycolatopsis sp. NPDC004747]
MPDPSERDPAHINKITPSVRVTLPEALLVVAALLSANVLWIRGFDVDSAIVKCGSAVAALTLAVTAPHRVLDIVRLRIIRDIAQTSHGDKFL